MRGKGRLIGSFASNEIHGVEQAGQRSRTVIRFRQRLPKTLGVEVEPRLTFSKARVEPNSQYVRHAGVAYTGNRCAQEFLNEWRGMIQSPPISREVELVELDPLSP